MIDIAAAMTQVVTALRAVAGIDSASTDPSDIIAPGVLVEFVGLSRVSLTGRDIELQLALVVADRDNLGAATALSSLLAKVETYASADGPIVARSVVLPSNPTAPLPGLLFPLTIRKEDT